MKQKKLTEQMLLIEECLNEEIFNNSLNDGLTKNLKEEMRQVKERLKEEMGRLEERLDEEIFGEDLAKMLTKEQMKTIKETVLEKEQRDPYEIIIWLDEKIKDAGYANHAKFYEHAGILSGTWNNFINLKTDPQPETLFKIVIGIKMTESDARKFLKNFQKNFSEKRDYLILGCIRGGIYDKDLIYDILEKFAYDKKGNRLYKNLY